MDAAAFNLSKWGRTMPNSGLPTADMITMMIIIKMFLYRTKTAYPLKITITGNIELNIHDFRKSVVSVFSI